ncbi:MAG: nucleotide exchange factor GrpE [Ktedonobacteraceae bacterium]
MQQHENEQNSQETIEQSAQTEQTAEQDRGETMARLQQELEAERHKSEEYLDLLRRSQADFVNYRRRAGQEQGEARSAGQMELLQRLLPVLDDLGRALAATPPDLAERPWVQGIQLVSRRLTSTLEELDVRQIGKEGEQFDPRWHEAVATGEQADAPEGTILHVAQPGYAMGERIIRPAQVVVAAAMSPTSS